MRFGYRCFGSGMTKRQQLPDTKDDRAKPGEKGDDQHGDCRPRNNEDSDHNIGQPADRQNRPRPWCRLGRRDQFDQATCG